MRRLVVAGLAGVQALVFAGADMRVARADEVDNLGGKVSELDVRVTELDRNLKPAPAPGPEIADRRLIDAQVLYELKNYEAASIILFDVVEKYPTSPAYPEALFYLADSLYLKRDYLSSRRFFEKIVEAGPQNARYQESLQRLIELSLHTGDYSPVDGYIAKLEATPSAKQLPSVPYVKGKYFFFRQQFDKALDALKGIGPGHIYYFHSLYFVASANVALGPARFDDALAAFGTILKTEAKTDSQKRITELAHLGVARILLERGQLTPALDEYAKIPTKSDYFNDALYESAWVSIKGKDYQRAARQLDLLQLNAPDSPLIPEVKLLIGSLHIRQSAYVQATDQFTKTRDEYTPVHAQLKDALLKTGDTPAYFRELIAKNLGNFDTAAIVPPVSLKWMRNDADVERVATLIGDESELRKSLDESAGLVARLEKAMNGPGRVNVFPELAQAHARSAALSNELTQVKQRLAAAESKLIAPVAGAEQELKQLEGERDRLEAKLRTLPITPEAIAERQRHQRDNYNELDKRVVELITQLAGARASAVATKKFYHDDVEKRLPTEQRAAGIAEIGGMLGELEGEEAAADALRRELDDARLSVGINDADMQLAAQLKVQYDDVLKRLHGLGVQVRSRLGANERAKAEQIASILDRAHAVEARLGQFDGRVDGMVDERLGELRGELGAERAKLGGFRSTLDGYAGESADVGGGIMAQSLRGITQRFYNVVVRADVGIIDVAWALKDSATRETNRLVAERKRELKLLDDEFKEAAKGTP